MKTQKVVLLKSHVSSYTKKDGTFVGEHENKVFKHASKKPPEGWHPKPNDKGKDHPINKLSKPTDLQSWLDGNQVATVTPHDAKSLPESLNGVDFAPWVDHPRTDEDWHYVEGQLDMDEPPMRIPKGKHESSGVIVEEEDGRVWLVHPTNGFGGYQATFSKGTIEGDDFPWQANAIKEAFEESGLKVEITGHLCDIERSTSMTRYYTARRVGGTPADMGWESQAVSLVPKEQLKSVLNQSVDHKISSMLGS